MQRVGAMSLFISACVLAAILLFVLCEYFFAEPSMSILQKMQLKYVGMLLSEIILFLCCILIYARLFPDSPARSMDRTIRLYRILLVVFASGPFGLMSLDRFVLERGLKFDVKFAEAGAVTGFVVLVFVVANYFNSKRYNELCKPENRDWSTKSPVA